LVRANVLGIERKTKADPYGMTNEKEEHGIDTGNSV
jgi:hypothetical protein